MAQASWTTDQQYYDPARIPPRANTSLALTGYTQGHSSVLNQLTGATATPSTQGYGGADSDIRLQPGYAEWYYSQNPRDPRAPAPIQSLSRYQAAPGARGGTPPPAQQQQPSHLSAYAPPTQQLQLYQQRPQPGVGLGGTGLGAGLGGTGVGLGGTGVGLGAPTGHYPPTSSGTGLGGTGVGIGHGQHHHAHAQLPQSYAQQQEAQARGTGTVGASGYNSQGRERGGFRADSGYRGRGSDRGRGGADRGRGRGDPYDRARGGGRRGEHVADNQPRSAFLEDFRLNGAKWTVDDVTGHLEELAKDQEGSRFIQRLLEANQGDDSSRVYDELLDVLDQVMTDVFGNYVVQKMLDFGTKVQIHSIAEKFQGHVLNLTLHTYGCRVVQKAIQVFDREDRLMVLADLRNQVGHCVQDQNGNHVIQKCIEYMPDDTDFIIDRFLGHVHEFATHAYGCRVIQCIFAHSSKRQDQVLQEIIKHVDSLTSDQFGNYVVQHVLQTSTNESAVQQMLAVLRPKFFPYCQHKFASNVMEKVYLRSNTEERNMLLHQLMQPATDIAAASNQDGETLSYLLVLMKDQYANYVVQQMIEQSDEGQRQMMVEHVRPQVQLLRRFTYGKHIVARLERTSATLQQQQQPTANRA